MDTLLGIDLGTTNCTVTAIDGNGIPRVIKNADGNYITPSAVYFGKERDKVIVGARAKEMASLDPENLVLFIKREMGKNASEVRYDKFLKKGNPYIFWDRTLPPEEISSMILKSLKNDAERELGLTIKKAVITCPAYFGTKEREATRQAGIIAGLDVLEVFPEPSAAAMSYGASVSDKENEKVFVFDLGGGTFDVTILQVVSGPNGKRFDQLVTEGDRKLGGKDWDDYLMSYMCDEFVKEHGVDVLAVKKSTEKSVAIGKLRTECENAKIALSNPNRKEASVTLSYGGVSLTRNFTREKYEEITRELIEKCRSYCENSLSEANLTWSDIDTVLMVGSMSNCPSVRDALQKWSGKKIQFGTVNPKTCVSEGAAIEAFKLCGGNTVSTLTKNPEYDSDNQSVIEKIAEEQENGERRQTCIESATNVLPASVGIVGRKNGEPVVFKMIKKNTTYPTRISQNFPLSFDNMETLEIDVVEGESTRPENCDKLGQVSLNLGGKLLHTDKIQVTLAMDRNGVLQVSALDIKNGVKVESVIHRNGAMSDQDLQNATEYLDGITLG